MTIRRADERDLPGMTDIYNDAILHSVATFDTEPKTVEQRRVWLRAHDEKYPALVAIDDDGRVLGWASVSRWSDRCAYAATGEISVYVDSSSRGRGVGTALSKSVLAEARAHGIHTVISRVTSGNEASAALHKSLGFVPVGTMKEVGTKFGRLLDVDILQIIFS